MSTTKQIIFKSHKMKRVYDVVDNIATSRDVNIMITGEFGVGKANLAKLIHMKDTRCGNIVIVEPTELKEIAGDIKVVDNFISEKLQDAKDGTIVIKSVNLLSLDVQERIAVLVKSQKSKGAARLIVTAHKDLHTQLKQNKASHVLCEILVVHIDVPPLRERREDIATYCSLFLRHKPISKEVLVLLSDYDWHGNVNELQGALTQLTLIAGESEITVAMLPSKIRKKSTSKSKSAIAEDLYKLAKGLLEGRSDEDGDTFDPYSEYQKYVEIPLIQAALNITKGNKVQAAKLININRNTLNKKIREYEIE